MLAEDMARFYDDPLGFVMYAYSWSEDPALQLVKLPEPWRSRYGCDYGPDQWACEELEAIGAAVRERAFDGTHAVEPQRRAIASGHGIGKSAFVAWLVDWIMSTRPMCRGTITATTSVQLSTRTWPQIAYWTGKCITAHWFDITTGKGAMRMWHKQHAKDKAWECSAQTCDEENSEAFAGQHAATSTSFYIFDEASGVPDKIAEVSEGGLTDGEPMKFAFGNPTQNGGWFHGAFHSRKSRWVKRQIDSRNVQITNKKEIDAWINEHGLDSDFVKIRVLGQFPAMSALQFFSIKDVDAARSRHLRPEQYNFAPKVLTLDNAWEGDDLGVIGLRQGLKYTTLLTFGKNDNDIEIAMKLKGFEDDLQADAVFIDAGYGTGVYSAGVTWGRDWRLVWFAGESPDPGYLNMRAWMAGEARNWLKGGGAIDPDDQQLYNDITAIHTVPRVDGKIQLEAKKDMKRRDLPSPGHYDAWAISFAYPVVKKYRGLTVPGTRNPTGPEYDPYAASQSRAVEQYDPYTVR